MTPRVAQPKGTYVNVRGVPLALKRALINDAAASQESVSVVAARIVARKLKMPVLIGRRRMRPTTNPVVNDQLNIRFANDNIPVRLDRLAAEAGLTRSSYVIMVLSQHYGLPHWPARPGGRKA